MASWKMVLLCKCGSLRNPEICENNKITFVSGPVPFECDMTPRFPEAPSLLANEIELHGDGSWA